MGVAISGCRPPGKDKPIFELAEDEMEMGVGIHGEKGRRRDKFPNADAVVDELFDAVSKDLPFNNGDKVGLMINGLGGTPPSELFLLYRRAALRCKDAGLNVVRNYVGEYLHFARDGRVLADADTARRRAHSTARRAGRNRLARLLNTSRLRRISDASGISERNSATGL